MIRSISASSPVALVGFARTVLSWKIQPDESGIIQTIYLTVSDFTATGMIEFALIRDGQAIITGYLNTPSHELKPYWYIGPGQYSISCTNRTGGATGFRSYLSMDLYNRRQDLKNGSGENDVSNK